MGMFLYGRNSIYERLKANPESIKKIILQEGFDVERIERLIHRHKIPVERTTLKKLSRIKPAKDLQGIIAEVEPYRYASLDELLDFSDRRVGLRPGLIFLDRLNDPQNLGVIIRTAACLGRFNIVIPRYNACGVTEAVLHVASGGENYVRVAEVVNISDAIIRAKEKGYWIIGGVISPEAKDIFNISIPFPVGVVLGSESEGIRYGVEKHLDIKAKIPMEGAALSLNVAMACAIFCYEIARQRLSIYR